MTYYCTVHKDEDQNFLRGELLDACTSHMVFDSFYDLAQYRQAPRPNCVIWEMAKNAEAKFGYSFKNLVGIPR